MNDKKLTVKKKNHKLNKIQKKESVTRTPSHSNIRFHNINFEKGEIRVRLC